MNRGWRALPLAPVYALLITSALVPLGGAVLQSPTTRVRFLDVPELPHRPFSVALVTERDNRLLGTGVIADTDGEVSFVTPTENAQLCVIPPATPSICQFVRANAKDLTFPARKPR